MVLELMTLQEAAWKMADVCAYVQPCQLVMAVSPELKALLKLANKAHPRLQAMMVDLHLYRPCLVEAVHKLALPKLHLHDAVNWEPNEDLEEATQLVQTALATPA